MKIQSAKKAELIEKLVGQVDHYDLETMTELLKECLRANYRKLSIEKLEKEAKEMEDIFGSVSQ